MRLETGALTIVIVLLCVFTAMTWLSPAQSQIEQDAKFTQVEYGARVRVGGSNTFRCTIYNAECSEDDQGGPRFFVEIYLDGAILFDEYNSTRYKTWNCSRGQTVSHSYEIRDWSATRPTTREVRISLYWLQGGTTHLEDTTSFKVAVTMVIPLQHIYATGYVAVYVIVCFLLFSYDYVAGLGE